MRCWAISLVLWLGLLPGGCERPAARSSAEAPSGEPEAELTAASAESSNAESDSNQAIPPGPADTVRRINELRLAGRLDELAVYVVAEHRDAVLELIRAIDQLAADNQHLQECLQGSGAAASARLFDRSNVANVIGVFSRDVRVFGEETALDTATVTIQIGDRLPLDHVSLRLEGEFWVIEPDAPIPGLADELRNLGKALRRVAAAVESRDLSVEQVGDELEFWQTPVMQRIERLTEKAGRGQRE